MHDWPAWLKPAVFTFATAERQSPSGSRMSGALLPSLARPRLRGVRERMPQPTSGEPVR